MRATQTYTKDSYEAYSGELVESIPVKRSLSTMLTSHAGSLMLQDDMLHVANDHCQAMLAQAALFHGDVNITKIFWKLMPEKLPNQWRGGDYMCKIVIVLVITIILVILANFIRVCCINHHYRSEQNRQYQRLMQEKIVLRRNAMDAYRTMIREDCREGGFWENDDADGNEETEDY